MLLLWPTCIVFEVVFRVKEVHSSTSDAAGVRDAGTGHGHSEQLGQLSPSSSPRAAGSNSGTPRASGPQVAVLGSPQVRDTAIITLGGGCVVWLCKGAAICCTLAHLLFSTVRSTGPKHHTTCISCKLAQTLRSQNMLHTQALWNYYNRLNLCVSFRPLWLPLSRALPCCQRWLSLAYG